MQAVTEGSWAAAISKRRKILCVQDGESLRPETLGWVERREKLPIMLTCPYGQLSMTFSFPLSFGTIQEQYILLSLSLQNVPPFQF